jgi:hypothetical protein
MEVLPLYNNPQMPASSRLRAKKVAGWVDPPAGSLQLTIPFGALVGVDDNAVREEVENREGFTLPGTS